MTTPTSAPEFSAGALMSLSPTCSAAGCQPLVGRVTFAGSGRVMGADANGVPGSAAGWRDAVGRVLGDAARAAAADDCPDGLRDGWVSLAVGDLVGDAKGIAVEGSRSADGKRVLGFPLAEGWGDVALGVGEG